MKANVTVEEFLAGETLRYQGFDFRGTEATYRVGDGVYVERRGKELGKAEVTDDRTARVLYHNLTRKQ